jgi:tetratricopeptide (TPR) repeat protein
MRILKSEIYPPLRSLFYWANENVDSRNYEEAIKWYKEYIRRAKAGEPHWDIELAHCYFRAARWLQHLGRTDEAISLSKDLLEKDPSWSESWCELAYIARIGGDDELSNRYLKRAKENRFIPRLFSERDKYGEEVK